MPVHNTLPYLAAAIESILSQTFGDFKFLIGDDASNDGSTELIRRYCVLDSRIQMMRSEVQLGPARSSSWIAEAALAPLVARMDGDDICHPDRLRLQVAALQAYPNAVLVTSLFQMIDRQSNVIRGADYSVMAKKGAYLPAPHSSIMYRRATYLAVGGYQPQTDFFEDRVLIDKLHSQGDALIIAAPLLSYRMGGVSARLNDDQSSVEDRLNRFDMFNSMGGNGLHLRAGISPLVYRSLGSLRLWSYQPPRILRSMSRRMRLRPLLPAIRTLLWAVIVTATPGLARSGARLLIAWRNWRVRGYVWPNNLYRWAANAPPEDLGSLGL